MPLIEWEASFNLGLEPFDQHHRHLVELLNDTYQTVMDRNPGEQLEEAFQDLIAYCDYHFKAEELWMDEVDYPHQARHVEGHRKFLQDILDFQNQFRNGQVLISFGLLKYLKDWLLDHILDEDRQLATHPAAQPKIRSRA